jgi:hypothetical protein
VETSDHTKKEWGVTGIANHPRAAVAYRFFPAFFLPAAFFAAFFAILPPRVVAAQRFPPKPERYYGWPEHSTLIQDVDYG